MRSFVSAEIIEGGAAVALRRPDGGCTRFHATWLRDNAQDPDTRAPGNGQRLTTLRDLPASTKLASASVSDDGVVAFVFHPDGKGATFPAAWLQSYAYDRERILTPGWLPPRTRVWDASLEAEIPSVDFESACADACALCTWLAAVRRYGFAKMMAGPVESGAVLKVAALFGHVRETNYRRWFDVRTELNPSNLAYTGLGLQAHTDNPYRDPVPTLAVLEGGQGSVDRHSTIQDLR